MDLLKRAEINTFRKIHLRRACYDLFQLKKSMCNLCLLDRQSRCSKFGVFRINEEFKRKVPKSEGLLSWAN